MTQTMRDERPALTAGKAVVFTQDEYEDFHDVGKYIALKDMSVAELEAKVEPLKSDRVEDDIAKVIPLLIREGYLLELEFSEIHLGCYREIEISVGFG